MNRGTRFLIARAGRPFLTGLVLVSYLIVILGLPLPHLAADAAEPSAPCASPTCCCPTVEQCQQQCCCAPQSNHSRPDDVSLHVASDTDERTILWRPMLQNRTCGGLATYWLCLLTPAVLPDGVSWRCDWLPIGWLTPCSFIPASQTYPPSIPPPRA